MIPILYSENETSFTTNGLGRLSDAIKCVVKEERNGIYECELEYPVTGVHYGDIQQSRIIFAKPADGKDPQPFRIYKIEKIITGRVRVYAEHLTYQANHIPVMPFEANSASAAMALMQSHTVGTNPFTLWTDKQTVGHYVQEVPETIRARLGGQEGSILDVYGGEYEWDRYTIKLHSQRGQDRGVVLRYGKNITDLTQENNITTTYTAVCPYIKESEDDPLITLPENYIASDNAGNFPYLRIKTVDFTKEFAKDEAISVEALRQKTRDYIAANNIGIPKISIKVSFVALWQTEEYKDIAPLERVNLCDIITVKFEKLGVEAQAKVIRTEYNVLLERYNSIEIGESKSTISATVATQEQRIINETESDLLRAQKHATELITGGLGGYVVLKMNANGKPEELLIMDTDNIDTAVNVWRYNKNGWGHSSTGYNGLYTLAATLDGGFVADFITTGTLNAALIKAGMLSDKVGRNFWDMVTGDFQLSAGVTVGGKTVNQIANEPLNTFISNTYSPDKINLQSQIDGKAETWYQSADPSSAWTTAALKRQHQGDLWYRTTDQTTWYYTYANGTYKWVQEDVPIEVFDQIDGKAQIFTSTPTPPYNVGDLWFQSASSDIMTCIRAKESGSFQASDWQKRNKYVDQAAIDTSIGNFDNALNQQKVFNKLTNNGQLEGIYMRNGRLYINASYIASGALADVGGNTLWDLTTGSLSSKKFSINSTYFKLEEDGKITSIATDGKKLVFDKGTITGYLASGPQSAKLEIGNGLFNIVGKLALNGKVGVSGATSFVKSINYEDTSLGNVVTAMGSQMVVTGVTIDTWRASGTASGTIYTSGNANVTVSGNISVSGYVNGQMVSMSGYNTLSGSVSVSSSGQASLPVTMDQNSPAVHTQTASVLQNATFSNLKYVKSVSAGTGAINSADGLIQSIS